MALALDKFVGLLQESGLMPREELDALLAEIPAPRKADGERLARELVKRKKLTAYQAQEVYGGRGKKLVLGNYVIQDKLGQGGMGMVLKAEHRRMERIVALKVMSKAAVESPEAVKRFHREVKAAAKLNHPNIVTAFDADEAGGTHFLVMEFVEGTDLSQLVKKNGPLPVEKALTCILGAARGLEFAHENGVVHRDIKPANLLLDAKGNVKILDMGLARIESVGGEQAELTGTGQIMGTVDYMAPEQAMNTRKADHRADIYSLGISLWYLLTGRVAYGGETVMEKLMAHQTAPIPSLAEAGVASSPALEAVFRKMVAKTPGERYQSTSEVVAALERCKTSPGDVSPTINLGPSEDAKLSDFLKGGAGVPPSGGSSRPAVALAPSAAPSTGAGLDVTIVTNTPQADTDPQTQTNFFPAPASKPWHSDWRVWAVGGGGFGGVVLLAVLGLWLFGNGSSPNAPPIAPSNNPQPDYALALDGKGRVQVPILKLSLDKPLTIEGYATPEQAGTYRHLFSAGPKEFGLRFHGAGQWSFFRVGVFHVSSQTVPLSRRTHVAAVIDGGEARLYLDGKLAGKQSFDPQALKSESATACLIGRDFVGELDEIGISGVARYTSDFTPPKSPRWDANTIALYHCDEGGGSVLRDSANQIRADGQVVGAKWVRAGADRIESTPNFELRLNGRNEYVDIPTLRYDGRHPLTIEAWATSDASAPANGQRLTNILSDVERGGLGLQLAGDHWQFMANDANREHPLGYLELRSQNPSVVGEPVHLAGVIQNRQLKFFVNGKLQKSGTLARDVVPSLLHFVIGADPTANGPYRSFFAGAIDEVRISKAARYERDFPPPARLHRFQADADTLALYHCDEGTGDVLRDASPNKHDGKIVGAKWVRAGESLDGVWKGQELIMSGVPVPKEKAEARELVITGERYALTRNGVTIEGVFRHDPAANPKTLEFIPQTGGAAAVANQPQLGIYTLEGDLLRFCVGAPAGPRPTALDSAPQGGSIQAYRRDRSPPPAIAPFNATEARAHQDAWAKHLGVPVEWENSLHMKFVLIPPGEFMMGSTAAENEAAIAAAGDNELLKEWLRTEIPRHKVILTKPIYLGVHEVTQAQYQKVMGQNPSAFASTGTAPREKEAVAGLDTSSFPVEMVGWHDAAEFCAKASQEEKLLPCYARRGQTVTPLAGNGYRLPTEAEWEFACRAGTTTYFSSGDREQDLESAAWSRKNSGGRPHPVGGLKGNPFALHDMHGNVAEWVQDGWEPNYYAQFQEKPAIDPSVAFGPDGNHPLRGGSWGSFAMPDGRSAQRYTSGAAANHLDPGFRVALSVEAVKADLARRAGTNFALQFDGVDDYVELPQLPAMPPGALLTVEAWTTLDQELAFRDGRCLFELGPMHVGAGGAPEGHERWIAAVLAPKFSPLPTNERAVLGRRTHIAVVLDPQGIVEYVDGKESLRKTYQDFGWAARDFWVNSLLAKKLLVGRGNGPPGTSPKYWPGTIDELRISTSRRYAADFTPKPRFEPDADTLALYHFDEGQGDVLTDASSNQRHGKVSGAKWVALPSSASTVMGPWHSLIEELYGWRQVEPRQPQAWSLENREFVSGSTPSSSLFLYEIEKFADFDLRAELQFADGADAGILFHVPNSRIDGGWEVEIGNLNRFTGDVVNVTDAQRNKIVSAPGEWHLLEISVRGQHCAVKVNGQTTATATLPTSRYPPPGMIALQGGAKPVRFRKLEVRLPSPELELTSTPQTWLRFNGKGDHVRIPSVSYDGDGPFTIEAWARVDPGRDSMHVLYLPGDHSLLLNFAWRTWCAATFLNGPTGVVAHAQTRPNANAWYHLAAVWDGRQLQFFVNGKLQQGKVHGFNGKQVGDVFYIGGEPPAVNGGDNSFFPGDIGPVRVSRSQRYQAQFAPPVRFTPDVDTVAIYNLDEGQGDILRDSSGHKHDGKIVGAQWMRTGSPPPPVENYELDLSPGGVRGDARVQLPNRRNDGPMTVELFVRPRSLAKGNQAVFSAHRVDLKQFDDHWAFVVTTPDFAKYDRILTPGVVAGRRTHLACTLNGQTITLFVDGKPAGTRIFADKLGADAVPWTLGRGAPFAENWSSLEGTIDEIRISDGVRYDREFTPVERLTADAQTWALYHCDEGSGEILWDNSGQWRDGKVIGAKWVRAGATVAPVPAPPIPAGPQPAAVPFDAITAKKHQAAWAKQLKVEVETPNSVGMTMVVIPPGQFMMGRSPRDGEVLPGEKLPDDDLPRHSVTLTKPFAIAATEVTQKQWKEVMGTNPWLKKPQTADDPEHPATYVSWKDAIEFCKRLSEKEKLADQKAAYRLPTEAEWEWACRAGTETTFNFGDDVKELYDHAWARFNSQDLPHPVAQKNPNEWGLFDMHGNAWEWADDVYGPYSAEAAVDPRSLAAGNKRTLRGGCFWSVPIADYRSSARRSWPEALGYSESGFRPVRTIEPQGTIDLLPLINPERDAIAGQWKLEQGCLVGAVGDGNKKLQVRYAPPEEYDLTMVVERTRPSTNQALTLVLGGRKQFGVTLDWLNRGNRNHGLSTVDDKLSVDNETLFVGDDFGRGKPVRMEIRVRRDSVALLFDGQLRREWTGAFQRLGVHDPWEIPDPTFLGLGTIFGEYRVHEWTVTPLTGR